MHEPHLAAPLGRALHDARRAAAHQQRAEGEAHLVDELGLGQLAEQVRPALAQHLGEAQLGQLRERIGQVDGGVAAHEHVGDGGERRAALLGRGGAGHDDGPRARLGEEGMLRPHIEASRDHGQPRLRRQPVRLTPRGIHGLEAQSAVALGAHGAGGHEHDVAQRAQHLHQPTIALAAERAAEAAERDRAVDARDEVHAHPRDLAIREGVCGAQLVSIRHQSFPSGRMLCSRYCGSRQPRIASTMRRASTVSTTLWARTMRAPCSTQ